MSGLATYLETTNLSKWAQNLVDMPDSVKTIMEDKRSKRGGVNTDLGCQRAIEVMYRSESEKDGSRPESSKGLSPHNPPRDDKTALSQGLYVLLAQSERLPRDRVEAKS
ncbi:hypothetical protein ACHAQD_008428 [Fusarium lateritium]